MGSLLRPISNSQRRGPALRGTFDDFLATLLAMESGLEPSLFDWYVLHYSRPVIEYLLVTAPGRVVLDPGTGRYLKKWLTIQEYFRTLGVEEMFSASDPESIRSMQYAAINPLGFVGYQIGEAILVQTGFYTPARVRVNGLEYDSYYVMSAPTGTCGGATQTVATDVNEWRGTFRGRYGIHSLDDLRTSRQEYVIRDLMDFNHASISAMLESEGTSLARELTVPRAIQCTLSGVLAAAHLCGTAAVVSFLRSGSDARDEFGTSLTQYMAQFGGYDTPYQGEV